MPLAFVATGHLYAESLMEKHRKHFGGSTGTDEVATARTRLQVQTGPRAQFHETNVHSSKWLAPKGKPTPFLPLTAGFAILLVFVLQITPLQGQKVILKFAVLVFCWLIEQSQLTQGPDDSSGSAEEAVGGHSWVQCQQKCPFGCGLWGSTACRGNSLLQCSMASWPKGTLENSWERTHQIAVRLFSHASCMPYATLSMDKT